MKIYYFQSLEKILFSTDVNEKIALFRDFYEFFSSKNIIFETTFIPKVQLAPSYAGFCQILHPTRIRRPKTPASRAALAKILHSIAHIEYSAIDLALDASYRFVKLPYGYYSDWLEVAEEEIEHFLSLQAILQQMGYEYGDFPVHQNLFNAMQATAHSLSHRMGLVHKALEATGLDANPFVIQKLSQSTHANKDPITKALDTILRDEIKHVHKGDKWWRFAKNPHEDFITLLRQYGAFSPAGRILNIKARQMAGYTQEELEGLQNLQAQKS